MKKWTVMVYLGADSSLSIEFLWAIKEMQEAEVGPTKNVALVAQFDPGQGLPTQRYVINEKVAKVPQSIKQFRDQEDGWLILDRREIDAEQKERETDEIEKLLKGDPWAPKYLKTHSGSTQPRRENTGDPLALIRFIYWGIKNFGATHYMVVLAGHGSGADGDFLPDQTSRDSLTLPELRDVFNLVKLMLVKKRHHNGQLDILGMLHVCRRSARCGTPK
jgi:hypothetical protein